jgi:hypothetical protein
MPVSLNVTFLGAIAPDLHLDQPPGGSIAKLLSAALRTDGWNVDDPENWRDVGWSLACSRGTVRLECALAGFGPNAWMLQIAPAYTPRLLGRLLRRQPTASPDAVHKLAKAVHCVLSDSFRGFRWEWDGPPSEASPVEPEALA